MEQHLEMSIRFRLCIRIILKLAVESFSCSDPCLARRHSNMRLLNKLYFVINFVFNYSNIGLFRHCDHSNIRFINVLFEVLPPQIKLMHKFLEARTLTLSSRQTQVFGQVLGSCFGRTKSGDLNSDG